MNGVYIPVKNQKFDIGRTINFAKCDCETCDFMNCPKNNYAVKMKLKPFTVKEFYGDYERDLHAANIVSPIAYNFPNEHKLIITNDLLIEFMDYMQFSFPKGTYWGTESDMSPSWFEDRGINDEWHPKKITFIKFSRKGEEFEIGNIDIATGNIWEGTFTDRQYKLAQKISKALMELKKLIVDKAYEENEDWHVGWLSPEGRFYPCRPTEHSRVAQLLDTDEIVLESSGWCKVIDDDLYMQSFDFRLTAEQRNWLSLRGYEIDND